MPTYDYECDVCGHTFELFQGISETVKKKCPACGKPKLRRLFGTGGAVMFKGSGFYQTDYRSESYRKAAEAEKKPSESASSSSDAGSSSDKKSSGQKSSETKSADSSASKKKKAD